jgi:hypothetical protein
VKLNGVLTEEIKHEYGLRQSDPIYPHLFLIYAKGFSSLLNVVEARGELAGVRIYAKALTTNHLLFADDSLLLVKANE